MMMGGWVTWIGVAGLCLLAVADVVNGDIDGASTKIAGAVSAVGLGRKIEKKKAITVINHADAAENKKSSHVQRKARG